MIEEGVLVRLNIDQALVPRISKCNHLIVMELQSCLAVLREIVGNHVALYPPYPPFDVSGKSHLADDEYEADLITWETSANQLELTRRFCGSYFMSNFGVVVSSRADEGAVRELLMSCDDSFDSAIARATDSCMNDTWIGIPVGPHRDWVLLLGNVAFISSVLSKAVADRIRTARICLAENGDCLWEDIPA